MRLALCLILLCFSGCATVTVGNYIKSDHPYSKKIYGNFDQILETTRQVLAKNGYKVTSESYPSVYERAADAHKESPKDVLLFTEVKQHSRIFYSAYTHFNVFVHALTDGAEVEIRYANTSSFLFKQVQNTRNDKLGAKILDQIERAMLVN
jgi:uncharacterized protein (DUF302 family)